MNKADGEFVLTLLHAATNAHLLHLRSTNYAEHVALGEFYTALPDMVDALAEAMQGNAQALLTFPIDYYAPAETGLEELTQLQEYVKEARSGIMQDSEIQNLVDEIAALIDSTTYKLRFLR